MAELPRPEIRIEIDHPLKHIYTAGSTVSGKVTFIPKFNARLRSLEINLRGECYTSNLGTQAAVSNVVPLFEISSKLLAAVYTFRNEIYEAPFLLTFPFETSMEQRAGPEALMPLFYQDIQPLPSSFVLSMKNTLQCVRYYIQVQLHGRSPATAEKAVLFRQAHPAPVTDDSSEQPLCLYALPLQSAQQRIWAERLRYAKAKGESKNMEWFLKPWKTPRVIYMPSICMPRKVTIGQDIQLLFAVDSIRNPMWKHDEYTFRLTAFSIALTAHTRTIMQNRPSKYVLQGKHARCLELPYNVLEVQDLRAPIKLDSDPIPLISNFRILPGTIPSFKTYTIDRSYSIDMHLTFHCDGEILQWSASIALDILPNSSIPLTEGINMDPLLLKNPRYSPDYFWASRILPGATESTARNNVYPADAEDKINLPRSLKNAVQSLPRSSYACASGTLAEVLIALDSEQANGKNRALSVVAGGRGVPKRKWLREMEVVVKPLNFLKIAILPL